MSSEYLTEEEHERLRKVCVENKPLPLWRLFREALLSGGACRDIVEKHVMCKLNGTDLKFFYEVNTETRKLVKRSSRKGELKKSLKSKRCRRYRLWSLRGSINRCGTRSLEEMTNHISAGKLLNE